MVAPAQWDVVVVGGGPAGAASAARLARLGHRVLVIDRAEFPRTKPCGECLNPAAVRALGDLGILERVRRAGGAPLAGWRIHPLHGPSFDGTFPDGATGLALPRSVLDSVVLEHAADSGAEVQLGERVTDLVRDDSRVVGVRTAGGEVRARLVIGADGLRSVVVRRLGLLRRTPRLRKLALAAHVRGAGGRGGRGEMYLTASGCIGVADLGGGTANVVVVVQGGEVDAVAGDRAGYFDRALRGIGLGAGVERLSEVLATGPFDWPVRSAVADGALLVGDAAGYYDPFTGQGIYRALRGAELAASAADGALRRGDASAAALAPYDRARRRAFAVGEGLQHLLEAVLARPRLFAPVARRFARRPALADALVAVSGDIEPARSLLRPRLLVQWIV